MKIFYLCPDLSFPSGGIRRLYTHVRILQEYGMRASILHFKKGFSPGWFESDVPVAYLDASPPLEPGDVLVVPEGFPNVMKKFKEVDLNRIVIALNPLYPFQSLPPGESWPDYGFDTVLTSSQFIADIIQWSMHIEDIHVLKTSIETKPFYYDPAVKRNQIAYTSRKDLNTPVIEKLIGIKDPDNQPFEFIKIENLKFDDYADVLRRSSIFLTTSPYEGTHRSILEAMACGCLCAGYHGFGGREYIISGGGEQNFFLAETMDFFGLAMIISELIDGLRNKSENLESVRSNGLRTAAAYQNKGEEESLLAFWSEYIETHSK
jgi:glycosyltransferase involved in cell wall biosynthesis